MIERVITEAEYKECETMIERVITEADIKNAKRW